MSAIDVKEITCGATFCRADLHIHSYGASYDVADKEATPQNIVATAIKENLQIIAITDHNDISNVRTAVSEGTTQGLLVIPGVELSTPQGHLLCYTPTAEAMENFFYRLAIEGAGQDAHCQTGMVECLNMIGAVGGFGVIAHIELRGAFEELMPRMNPAKRDIIAHHSLLGIEVTDAACPILYNS